VLDLDPMRYHLVRSEDLAAHVGDLLRRAPRLQVERVGRPGGARHLVRRPRAPARRRPCPHRPSGAGLPAGAPGPGGVGVVVAALPRLDPARRRAARRPGPGRGPDGLPDRAAGRGAVVRLPAAAARRPGAGRVHRVLARPPRRRRLRPGAARVPGPARGPVGRAPGARGDRCHPHDGRGVRPLSRPARAARRDRRRRHPRVDRLHVRGDAARRPGRRGPGRRRRARAPRRAAAPAALPGTAPVDGRGAAPGARGRPRRRPTLLHRPVRPQARRGGAALPRRHDHPRAGGRRDARLPDVGHDPDRRQRRGRPGPPPGTPRRPGNHRARPGEHRPPRASPAPRLPWGRARRPGPAGAEARGGATGWTSGTSCSS
jgi:hypothetical protein